jgi:hypothetical protein
VTDRTEKRGRLFAAPSIVGLAASLILVGLS